MRNISAKRRIVLTMMIFILPLLGLLVWYNLYNVNTLNKRIAETNRNTLELFSISCERNLRDIESYMANFLANDTDSIQMSYPLSTLQSHVLSDQILLKYRTMMGTKNSMAAVFFHSENNGVTRETYNHSYSYETKAAMESFVKSTLQEPDSYLGKGWFYHSIEETPFLFCFLSNNGVVHVGVVDLDYVEVPQKNAGDDKQGLLFFADPEGVPVTGEEKLKEAGVKLEPFDRPYSIQGKRGNSYFLIQTSIQEYGLALYYAMPYHGWLLNMDVVQVTILVGSIAIILLILFSFYFLTKFVLQPFDSLVSTMEKVRKGQLDAKLKTSSSIDEFIRLQDTFNAMMDEIQSLKIASYEQHLERQQVELQYLQIQIRPHFFLNCLKNLYALAQGQSYIQMQEMILRLSEHLRFLFQETKSLVPVEIELKNVENFIALQQLVQHSPPVFTARVDSRLKALRVPPLSLLTFVENSVKHGSVPEKTLEIHISLTLLEDEAGKYVSLVIRDNGRGFSEESLKHLQTGIWDGENQHLGIQNVSKRFQLIYGDQCTFFFSNRGGAETEIFFPMLDKSDRRVKEEGL